MLGPVGRGNCYFIRDKRLGRGGGTQLVEQLSGKKRRQPTQ
jgi:hypothetical protein